MAAAIVAGSGILAGLLVNVDRATRDGQDLGLVLANYFSMFTIVSSILSVIVLSVAAHWMRRHPGRTPEPVGVALALAAVTGPVILLGVVFNVLLRGEPPAIAATDPLWVANLDSWATETLHVVLPLYFVVDLLFASRRRGLPWRALTVILSYPLAWTTYTLIRGELVPNPDGSAPWWYPYGFLDPHVAGYGSAFAYIGGILFAFLLLGIAIIGIGRSRERYAAAHVRVARLRIRALPGQVVAWFRRHRRRPSGPSAG
ncbi:Pr6Pr family membrane protein [Agromyces sp. SYSU T00266]|uniref:Pr6Pr family membrane protein n=1 Tax=Agromyces zhanjiangensis TaxID=3158562 RepID=UPI0033955EC9